MAERSCHGAGRCLAWRRSRRGAPHRARGWLRAVLTFRGAPVVDEWVTQLLRQGDAKVFKKYSQMKLQMKREALAKLNRHANETGPGFGTVQGPAEPGFGTVLAQ